MVSFDTTFLDYPSPDDIAVIVYISGCEHNCPGCQNAALQHVYSDFSEAEIGSLIAQIDEYCERNDTKKVVLSGGDWLAPKNREYLKQICFYLGEKLDICIYTGYSIDEVKEMGITGFKYIKCGKFDCENMQKAEKTDEYIQFVNKTQNLYDSEYQQLSYEGRFNFK
jgi:anaerobic ribonucleoside-triphosphate reductase activating protein